jgi:hypothetical protein
VPDLEPQPEPEPEQPSAAMQDEYSYDADFGNVEDAADLPETSHQLSPSARDEHDWF